MIATIAFVVGATLATDVAGQTVREPEVESLDFVGNHAFSGGELESVLRSRETKCVSVLLRPFCWLTDWGFAHRRQYLDSLNVVEDELRLQLFYRDRGFFSAAADSRVTRHGKKARVRFTIVEGAPTMIDSLTVRGVPPGIDSAEVARLLDIEAGDRFDQFHLAVGEDSLVRGLRERGYIQATVLEDLLRRPGVGAQVTLDVNPGPLFRVGDIDVQGAEDIGEEVVRDLLRLGPGMSIGRA